MTATLMRSESPMPRFLLLLLTLTILAACGSSFSGLPLPQQGLFLVKSGNRVAYVTGECVMAGGPCASIEVLKSNAWIRYLQSAPDGSAVAAVVSRLVRPNSQIVNSEIRVHFLGAQQWLRIETFDNLNEIEFAPRPGGVAISGTLKTETDHAGATDNRIVEEQVYIWEDGQFRPLTEGLIGTKTSVTWIDENKLLFESEYGPEEMPCALYRIDVNTSERILLLETGCNSDPTLSPTGEQILWRDFETLNISDADGSNTRPFAALETQAQAFFWTTDGENVIVLETVEYDPDWVIQIKRIDAETLEQEVLYREAGLAFGTLAHMEGEDFIFLRELNGFGTLAKIQLLSLSDGTLLDITPEMLGTGELPEQVWWHPQPQE